MLFRKLVIFAGAWLCATIFCFADHLEVVGTQRLELDYDYTAPGTSGRAARFYLPIPPNTGCQTIESFHSNWPGQSIANDVSSKQRLLAGRVPASARTRWHVRVLGTFTMHELVADGATSAHPLPRPTGFDGTSESLDWNSAAFQDWLDDHGLRRGREESSIAYAHRLYDELVAHGKYVYPPQGGWVASRAARHLRTDCGGFSLVFVAACRANRIPARLLVGQWLKVRGDGLLAQGSRQAHVIAEFFDPSVGWIPEDISSALMQVGGRTDYFGREPGYFFAWHFDTDFHFAVPPGADGHVQWIQNPSPWFAGDQAEGSSHRWTITPLP